MKILVPVKHVASLRDGAAPDADGALPADALQWATNEWDPFALEAALALRDSDSGGAGDSSDDEHGSDGDSGGAARESAGEVLVVTVGDERAEQSLRAGLAIGADRAVRVWDDTFASDARGGLDPLAVARVLAALAERERPDLIVCGAQSSDAASAATGVALAGLLGLAHVAVVTQIERDGKRLTVERELDGGASEIVRVALPALLTVQTGANRPRRANLRAIKLARAEPIALLDLSGVGLDAPKLAASAGSRTLRLRERERSSRATPIEGTPFEIAARISTIVEQALSR
jgi:electron transfer flavoprotein beta subunit